MKHHHSSFGLLISLWIHLNLNQICATNIPNPSLAAESYTAGSLATPDFDNSVLNLTSLGAVDPAFGFVPIFSGDKLRPIPCLLNSVNVALQLGLEDYEGFIFETVFRLESHPQVEIAVIPDEEGGSIPRKYAVWGLNAGIDLMIKNLNFQTAVFILSYRGRGVACITYKATGAPHPIAIDITNATESINKTLPHSKSATRFLQASTNANTTNVNTIDATNDPHLRVDFQLTGSVITIYNIFYMAIDMLRELAPFSQTDRFADTRTLISAANLILSTQQNNPPRTVRNPPYFQVEWLMRALAQTPAYMLEQGSFREVNMILFVDEVKVGEISVKRPGTEIGLIQASGDVATS